MSVRFVFFLVHFVVGALCYGMHEGLPLKQRAKAMALVLYTQYKIKHGELVSHVPASIGGIKAVVTTITRDNFEQLSTQHATPFSEAEINQLYADGKSFGFVSIYRNNGDFVFNSIINDVVCERTPMFVAKKLPGEAVVVGLHKNREGVLRVVRTICLNLGAHYVHDPIADKPRFVSENKQWESVARYYGEFKKEQARLVRDKYGQTMLCEESCKKQIAVPDGQ